MHPRLVFAVLAAAALSASVQAAPRLGYRPPRTASGQPDLQGIWSSASLTRLERPAVFTSLTVTEAQASSAPYLLPPDEVGADQTEWYDPGLTLGRIGGRLRSSWIVEPADGRLPYSDAGRRSLAASESNSDGPERRPMNERCFSAVAGPPMLNGFYNNNWRIVQTRDAVVIQMETNHEVRVVRLGDRSRLPAALHPWMGDSIGRWDGDALVVETTNFSPSQSRRRYGLADLYLSSAAKVTERFARISATGILYSFTVEDPATYTQPWRGEIPLTATKGPIYEYACHEGNYSLPGILAAARQQEREAAAKP